MKVLQINSVCGLGSTGRIATDLYKVLEEQGHECVIAYGRGKAPEGIKTIKIGTNFDNYMHVAKTRIFDKHGFGSKKATKEFIKKVEEYDPDIIHLHNIHGYYINIEILFEYLKKSNKKVIWTLHDCWAFTGHCSHFDAINCNDWEKQCKHCPKKREYPSSYFKDNSQFNFIKKKEIFNGIKNMIIVTPSKWLAKLVKKSFLKEYKVIVINNGIDLEVFKPRKGNFKKKYGVEDKKIILGVANIWDKRKGIDYFVKLSKELSNDYKIVLVGVNKKLKKILPDNIIKINRTDNIEELCEIYSDAYVFLNPSCEETMGLVTVEALACGIPVIVNNATAIPEVVDYSCGRVFNKNDYNDLFKKLVCLNKARISSKDCINRAKKYDKHDKYMEYINLYICY